MNVLLAIVLVPYYVGCLVAAFVYPARIGGSPSAYVTAVMHPESRRNGIPWLVVTMAKIVAWPVVLYLWLKNGQPPSTVLYGPKAAERLGLDPDKHRAFATKWTGDTA